MSPLLIVYSTLIRGQVHCFITLISYSFLQKGKEKTRVSIRFILILGSLRSSLRSPFHARVAVSSLCVSFLSCFVARLFLSSFCLCFRRPLSHVVVRTLDTEHFLRPLICNKSLDATSPFSESCYFSCLHNENDVTKKDVSRHGKECTPDCLARKKTSPVCDYFLHSSFLWTMFVLLVFPTPLFRDHCLTDEDVKTTKWSPWPKEEVPHDFPFVLVISGVSLCL